MTRNRDDFSALQALRVGIVGTLVIAALMIALGAVIADHKKAALDRATNVAASSLQFTTGNTELAQTETADARG